MLGLKVFESNLAVVTLEVFANWGETFQMILITETSKLPVWITAVYLSFLKRNLQMLRWKICSHLRGVYFSDIV